MTLTFDLVAPVSIRVIYCPTPMHMRSIKPIGESVYELLIRKDCTLNVSVTLTFDLVNPISIGVIYCLRPMQMRSIKPISESVEKLLIGTDFHA